MQEGCLSENMVTGPSNPYAKAKDLLRKKLEDFGREYPFALKWVRLFYMYGKGQNPNSLLSQLDKAITNGDEVFNMSGGQQTRDYLPVQKVAEYIVKISLQNNVTGIINCCSGEPVVLKQFVEDYLRKINKTVFLNFGYYPYPDFEPMHFWGNNEKLKTILHNE
jgi:nucleoside-diphosphate-sugar epimerase